MSWGFTFARKQKSILFEKMFSSPFSPIRFLFLLFHHYHFSVRFEWFSYFWGFMIFCSILRFYDDYFHIWQTIDVLFYIVFFGCSHSLSLLYTILMIISCQSLKDDHIDWIALHWDASKHDTIDQNVCCNFIVTKWMRWFNPGTQNDHLNGTHCQKKRDDGTVWKKEK